MHKINTSKNLLFLAFLFIYTTMTANVLGCDLTVLISATSPICEGTSTTATATVSGSFSGVVMYQWEKSTDNVIWTSVSESGPSCTLLCLSDTYLRVTASADTCSKSSDSFLITVLPVPKVYVTHSDTACEQYNLVYMNIWETSGMVYDYTVTLHTSLPTSAIDNQFLIPVSEYIVTETQNVYVRMSVDDLCYDVGMGKIIVKSEEECNPASISQNKTNSCITVYPTYVNDYTTIEFDLEQTAKIHISIIDSFGRIVIDNNEEFLMKGKANKKMDLSKLKVGNYILLIEVNDKKVTKKIIKS